LIIGPYCYNDHRSWTYEWFPSLLMDPNHASLGNWMSNNTDINKQWKHHRFASTQDHTHHHKKMNDTMIMNSTIAGSVNILNIFWMTLVHRV
jgi:hypothetical protein